MALTDVGLNRSRSAIVFIVPESVNGTIDSQRTSKVLDRPQHTSDTDTDAFGLVSVPVIGQQGNYSDTSEIGPELITTDRVLNYMEYSTFDFEYYAKPGGRVVATSGATFSSGGSIANSTTTYTITDNGNMGGFAIGDTVLVSGTGSADADGLQLLTNKTANTVEFTGKNSSPSFSASTITVAKVTFTIPKEDVILSKCFGGRKFMSTAHTGYTSGSTDTALGGTPLTSANSTCVSYFLKNISETLTVHSRQFTSDAVQMYTATGSLPTSFSATFAKDGAVTYSSGFQSNRVFYTGTAQISPNWGGNGQVTAQTSFDVTVTSPKRHHKDAAATASDVVYTQSISGSINVGSQVMIRAKKGATVGGSASSADEDFGPYEVKAISGATVTLDGNTGIASGKAVTAGTVFLIPFSPTANLTTSVIDQRKVQVFLADAIKDASATPNLLHYNPGTAGVTDANALSSGTSATSSHLYNLGNVLDVTSVNFDFDRAITTPALTEMTGEEFPAASYVINEPTITGSMTLLLRPKDFQFMNSLRDEPRRAIGVRVGSVEGKIIEMGATSAFFEVPTPADADGATQIDIPFTVIRGDLGETDDANKFFLRYR
jgi:hypothetical protein